MRCGGGEAGISARLSPRGRAVSCVLEIHTCCCVVLKQPEEMQYKLARQGHSQVSLADPEPEPLLFTPGQDKSAQRSGENTPAQHNLHINRRGPRAVKAFPKARPLGPTHPPTRTTCVAPPALLSIVLSRFGRAACFCTPFPRFLAHAADLRCESAQKPGPDSGNEIQGRASRKTLASGVLSSL